MSANILSNIYNFLFEFNSLNLASSRRNINKEQSKDTNKSHEIRQAFGQNVYWVKGRHVEKEELEEYRYMGDDEMDHLLNLCEEQKIDLGYNTLNSDIIELVRQAYQKTNQSSADKALASFYENHTNIPSWVDFEQIQRGIDVYILYLPAISLSLFYRSLVGGFSIPKITAVLSFTKYLAPPSTSLEVTHRLLDTGGFLSSCLLSNNLPASTLRPNGKGWEAALRVRALHAKVRRHILTKEWDDALGIPINQEDMAATLLGFCVNSLLGIEFIASMPLSDQDQYDFIMLWRYIGWLLGIQTRISDDVADKCIDPCGPNVRNGDDAITHSYSLLESIILHILHPNDTSVEVAHHLLHIGRYDIQSNKTMSRSYLSRTFRELVCRRFLGDPLADSLKLASGSEKHWVFSILYFCTTLYLLILRIYTCLTIFAPEFVRRVIYKYHLYGLRKFYLFWSSNYQTRKKLVGKSSLKHSGMDDKFAPGRRSSSVSTISSSAISSDDIDTHNDVDAKGRSGSSTTSSDCPFRFF